MRRLEQEQEGMSRSGWIEHNETNLRVLLDNYKNNEEKGSIEYVCNIGYQENCQEYWGDSNRGSMVDNSLGRLSSVRISLAVKKQSTDNDGFKVDNRI